MDINFNTFKGIRNDLAIPLAQDEHNDFMGNDCFPNKDVGNALHPFPSYRIGDESTNSIPTQSYYYHAQIDCIDGWTLCAPIAAMIVLLLFVLIFIPVAFTVVVIIFVVSGLIVLCSGNGIPQVRIYYLIRQARNAIVQEAKIFSRNPTLEPHQTSQDDIRAGAPTLHHSAELDATNNLNPAANLNWSSLSGTYKCTGDDGNDLTTEIDGSRTTIDLVLSESTPSWFSSRTNRLFGIKGGNNSRQFTRLWKISGHSVKIVTSSSTQGETEMADEPHNKRISSADPSSSGHERGVGNDYIIHETYTTGFVVSQGLLADSGRIYWVEHHHGDVDVTTVNASPCSPTSLWSAMGMPITERQRIVLVQGRLDYDTQVFTGTWTDSHGNSGVYSTLTRQNQIESDSTWSEVPTTSTNESAQADYEAVDKVPDRDVENEPFDDDIDEQRDPSTSRGSIRENGPI